MVVLAGAGWYVYQQQGGMPPAATVGEYAYQCDNGTQFSMTPSADMSFVTLFAGQPAMFSGSVVVHKMGDGNHYETAPGAPLIVFSGAGEEVQLWVGEQTTTCNPVPSTDSAPWNWGDSGEGAGSIQPDAGLVVFESIQGKWQSTDDPKFVREFKDGGVVVDYYEGAEVTRGLYVAFTKGPNAPKQIAFPLMDNKVYLQLTVTGSQADTLNFSVEKLTPEELVLVYLDRGGVQSYTLVR